MALLALTAVLAGTAASARADAYGPPLVANTFTTGRQEPTSLFNCANGDTVVVWWDVPRNAYYMRGYNRGMPTQRSESQVGAALSTSGAGCFGIVSSPPDGSGLGAYVTIYDAAGNVKIPQFRVNDATNGDQAAFKVAVNGSGRFAVTWYDWGRRGTYVRSYSPSGTPLTGDQLVISDAEPGSAWAEDLVMDQQGAFIVAFSVNIGSGLRDIYVRRFSSTGFALGPAVKANTSSGENRVTQVAMSPSGFIATWMNGTGSPQTYRILAQRFDTGGNKLGGEFQVNTEPMPLAIPWVAAAGNGNFTIAWFDTNTPSAVYRQLARSYLANGSPAGGPFVLHPASTLHNAGGVITMDADGNATILWQQTNAAGDDADVIVRRYQPTGIVVQPITAGVPVPGLSGVSGSWQYFKFTVPAGQTVVDVSITGAGDADLYLRYGELPSATRWDARPFIDGSNEAVEMLNFPPGDWYVGVNGFTAYSSVSLQLQTR